MFKDILTFVWLNYRDDSLIILYIFGSIPKSYKTDNYNAYNFVVEKIKTKHV